MNACSARRDPATRPCSDSGSEDTELFGNLGVHADVKLTLHMRSPDDTSVSILFGHERFRLEFMDTESLERLRDLAEEGMRRLRTAATLAQRTDIDEPACQPVA